MKERPILFSAPMVRALLDGRKTQTRRALRIQPLDVLPMNAGGHWIGLMSRDPEPAGKLFRCKFGVPGDHLWVKETWRVSAKNDDLPPRDLPFDRGMTIMYSAGGSRAHDETGQYVNDGQYPLWPPSWAGKQRPSIFMPRAASRLTLRITDVRCERLQDISEADAKAEGIEPEGDCWKSYEIIHEGRHKGTPNPHSVVPNRSPIVSYRELWESINGAESWDANPWVWAVTFETKGPK
jgi:hypothetical protein